MNKNTLFCKETAFLPSPDFPKAPRPPAQVATMLTTLHTFPLQKGLRLLQTCLQILSRGSTPVPASSKCKPCTESQGLSDALLSGTNPAVQRGLTCSSSPRTCRRRAFAVSWRESRRLCPGHTMKGKKRTGRPSVCLVDGPMFQK